MSIEIKPGDFVVIDRRYGWIVVRASKVTAQRFKASGEWSSRDHVYSNETAVFSGDEAEARALAEKLQESNAICNDERNESSERRAKRNAELIAAASK